MAFQTVVGIGDGKEGRKEGRAQEGYLLWSGSYHIILFIRY